MALREAMTQSAAAYLPPGERVQAVIGTQTASQWLAAPVEDQIARLDALAAEVIARGWIAYIATPLGRLARLFVQDPRDRAISGDIMASPDGATGDWWFWFGWAERIAPADRPARAAQAIVAALRRPLPGSRFSSSGWRGPGVAGMLATGQRSLSARREGHVKDRAFRDPG